MIKRTWRFNPEGLVILALKVFGVTVHERALLPWEQPPEHKWGWHYPVKEKRTTLTTDPPRLDRQHFKEDPRG